MPWVLLITAGLFEAAFAFCLGKARQSAGTESWIWYGIFGVNLVLSMYFLLASTRTIPIGTAYAVWTGIGALGAVLIGIFYFHEPATFWRLVFLSGLIVSIVGLKFAS